MEHRRKKILKAAFTLSCAFLLIVLGSGLWAAPKLIQSAKGGNCAACHTDQPALSQSHPDTKDMNLEACRACHTRENMDLTGKLPASHMHLLGGVSCEACHGKTNKPEETPMEKCVACHGPTAKLAEKTKDVKPTNPHTSPHYGTELDCNLCHHQHKKSENYCAQCHSFDFKTP
ncbi:MAG TPA: cytochrome c3 family protein [Smithellaceae bacterium]|nr:cytochrome c3 family protein [Smithellaceae bacterium]